MLVIKEEEVICSFLSGLTRRIYRFFQVYQDGVRNVNVMFIFRHVTLPVVTCLLLAVSIPYVIAAGVVPIFGEYELLHFFLLLLLFFLNHYHTHWLQYFYGHLHHLQG